MQRLLHARSDEARLRQELAAEREQARKEAELHRHAVAQLQEQRIVRPVAARCAASGCFAFQLVYMTYGCPSWFQGQSRSALSTQKLTERTLCHCVLEGNSGPSFGMS